MLVTDTFDEESERAAASISLAERVVARAANHASLYPYEMDTVIAEQVPHSSSSTLGHRSSHPGPLRLDG